MAQRIHIIGLFVVAATAPHVFAQTPKLEAYVPNTEIVQDRPFWLIVEATGATVDTPVITQGEHVVINTNSSNMQTQFTLSGSDRRQFLRMSYVATAIQTGSVEIPPVRARVDGKILETEPITIDVKPAPAGSAPMSDVRAWTSATNVTLGEALWIYVEATGIQIDLPDTVELDWATVDPRTAIRSSSYSSGQQGQRTTEKIGYLAIPTKVGTFQIPPIDVRVTGRILQSEPIEVTVHKQEVKAEVPSGPPPDAELTQDDLVFIKMDVDKKTSYQGEPILLTMQLWRIQNRRITSGPYRGALIYGPSTEGFFVREIEPVSYEAQRGPWTYDVTETAKLLYPTRSGVLTIGEWHWEGIALVNRQSIVQRDKLYYKFDAGPIDIAVMALPPAPHGFTGAVGEFDVNAELTPSIVTQGVPLKLRVRVEGFGNPDAIGDPVLPELAWATVREPERELTFTNVDGNPQPRLDKRFTYTLTPVREGRVEIPEFSFVYFHPAAAKYETRTLGPFSVDVMASGEDSTYLLASPEVPTAERRVTILAEDIRPMMERRGTLEVHDAPPGLWLVPFVLPVLGYAALAMRHARARRLREDVGWARSQSAHRSGMRRLQDVARAQDPAEALYRALVAFAADAFNFDGAGKTSADIDAELAVAGVPGNVRERTVQILRACERERYASQRLSNDEILALIGGAESCMSAIDARSRGRSK
jgi:hypothetical protein